MKQEAEPGQGGGGGGGGGDQGPTGVAFGLGGEGLGGKQVEGQSRMHGTSTSPKQIPTVAPPISPRLVPLSPVVVRHGGASSGACVCV